MGRRFRAALVTGVVLWAGLTAACSSAVEGPPTGRGWGGEVAPIERERLRGDALAIDWDEAANTEALYRLDARTLRLHDGFRLRTRGLSAWDLSPDGSLLLASAKTRVRVIDLDRGRYVADFETQGLSFVHGAWVDDDVAILVGSSRGRSVLVRVRPSTGTVLDRVFFEGTAFAFADAGTAVATLLYSEPKEPPPAPLPVQLAIMDASGREKGLRLDDVGAGWHQAPGADYGSRALPALAAAGSRATVVGTDGTVVSVDLDDFEITVEGEPGSVLESLAAWFVPPAHAKILDATGLRAEWMSEGELLVSGYRTTSTRISRNDVEMVTDPVGAVVLHADDWSETVVDPDAYSARIAGGRVLTWTSHMYGDERHEGIGVRAYDSGGGLAWERFERQFATVLGVHHGIAIVEHGWHRVLLSSVDVGTGEVLKTRELGLTFVDV